MRMPIPRQQSIGYSLGLALDESALASSLFLSPPDVDEAGLPVELDAVDEWAA